MKKLILTSALSVLAFTFALQSNAQALQQTATPAVKATPAQTAPVAPKPDNPNAPKFKWSEDTWDFGTIPQGTPVTHSFNFTNVGAEPLVISTCDKSCGCTTPKWTTEPTLPNKSGYVSATYNAANPGAFTKTVTVHSNAAGGDKVLYIKGTVGPKAPTEAPAQQAPATTPQK